MADQIRVGTVFIEENTPVPDSLVFESAPYSDGWRSVKNLNSYDLDRKIRAAGWTLFDLSHVNASVFGFDREKAVHRAVKRALAKTKSDSFNALEISQVAAKRFLGLSCVTVVGIPTFSDLERDTLVGWASENVGGTMYSVLPLGALEKMSSHTTS